MNFSLQFFFNRKGKVVQLVLALGWLLAFFHLMNLPMTWEEQGSWFSGNYLFLMILALSLTVQRLVPWYKADDRGQGIESHFQKNLVPVAYLLVIINGLMFVWPKPWPLLILANLFFLAMQVVNFILIYFHKRDSDLTPPSYFSRPDSKAVDVRKC